MGLSRDKPLELEYGNSVPKNTYRMLNIIEGLPSISLFFTTEEKVNETIKNYKT